MIIFMVITILITVIVMIIVIVITFSTFRFKQQQKQQIPTVTSTPASPAKVKHLYFQHDHHIIIIIPITIHIILLLQGELDPPARLAAEQPQEDHRGRNLVWSQETSGQRRQRGIEKSSLEHDHRVCETSKRKDRDHQRGEGGKREGGIERSATAAAWDVAEDQDDPKAGLGQEDLLLLRLLLSEEHLVKVDHQPLFLMSILSQMTLTSPPFTTS